MMKKNIDVIIKFKLNGFLILANERIGNDFINIYKSDRSFVGSTNYSALIKKDLDIIQSENNCKIDSVYIHLEQDKFYDISQDILVQKELFSNLHTLNLKDFYKITTKLREYCYQSKTINKTHSILSVRAFQFEYVNKDDKKILVNKFPLHSKVKAISIYFSVTKIVKSVVKKLFRIFSEIGIKIAKIFTPSDLSNFNLDISPNDRLIIDIQNSYSALFYYKNNSVVFSKNLSFSFNHLIDKVSQNLQISKKTAKLILANDFDLISTLDTKTVFINNEKIIKLAKIKETIKSLISTILKEAKNIISEKNKSLENVKIYVTGVIDQIENIDFYSTKVFNKTVAKLKEKNVSESLHKQVFLSKLIYKYFNWKQRGIISYKENNAKFNRHKELPILESNSYEKDIQMSIF